MVFQFYLSLESYTTASAFDMNVNITPLSQYLEVVESSYVLLNCYNGLNQIPFHRLLRLFTLLLCWYLFKGFYIVRTTGEMSVNNFVSDVFLSLQHFHFHLVTYIQGEINYLKISRFTHRYSQHGSNKIIQHTNDIPILSVKVMM